MAGVSPRPAAITIDAAPRPAARGLQASLSREFDASPPEQHGNPLTIAD
jgi:hypothetical protein